MDPKQFEIETKKIFSTVLESMDAFDLDDLDIDATSDVIKLNFANKQVVVLNTQRATWQLWLAGAGRGYHFSWDAVQKKWLTEKNEELFNTLEQLCRTHGLEVTWNI